MGNEVPIKIRKSKSTRQGHLLKMKISKWKAVKGCIIYSNKNSKTLLLPIDHKLSDSTAAEYSQMEQELEIQG